MSALAEALGAVHERIERACRRAGRAPETVRLVAVTKTVLAERIREAQQAGQRLFGENRVQEALRKMPEVGPGASWHLIGHLQRNKARDAVGRFELIHGVDSARLAQELERQAAARGLRQAVLLQVNLAGESSKSGADADALEALLDEARTCTHLDVRGLMAIPPPVERPEESRPWFRQLRQLGERLGLPELSMGMTDDFEVAIEEGATLVRVGRAIFGER